MNYFDILLAKKLEDDRDPKVEGLSVTENGRYHEDGVVYDPVIVALPLDSKSVTANGTYAASDDNLAGYSSVSVNVSGYTLEEIENVEIASFTSDDLPMPTLKIGIEPQQDLHGYEYPWVGGSGKNKAKPYSYTVTAPNGVTFTYNGDGSVTLNGTATASQAVPSVSVAVQNNLTFTLPSGTYIPSVSANNVSYEVYDTATSTLLSNGASFTISESKTVLFRVGAVNGQTYNNLKVLMQIERGQTATSYAPYSNICPIIGWTEANVSVSGVNCLNNALFTNNKWLENNGTISDYNNRKSTLGFIPIGKIKTFWCGTFINNELRTGDYNIKICTYSAEDASSLVRSIANGINGNTFTFNDDEKYFRIGVVSNDHDVAMNYPSTDTSYHAYNGQTYTIQFVDSGNPLTVYKGELDVTTGDLKVYPHYDSYNGETINGEWISDRDAYAVGTTPTTGAEVQVMSGSDYTTYQLTPTQVWSLVNQNNVTADCGNILDLKYFKPL